MLKAMERVPPRLNKESIGNYEDYLTSLDMELTVAPFDQIGRQRIV